MKKVIAICAVAAMLSFVGSVETAKADHCSSGSSFRIGFGQPTYYRSYNSYNSYPTTYYRSSNYGYGYGGNTYARPVYSRPSFSISIGSGYRSSGYRSSGYRSYGNSHNHYRSYNRSPFHRH
jgi:hypothetical protein